MDGLGDLIAKRARAAKPNVKLHSPAHVLADEISSAFGERKRFAMYLGVINRVGVDEGRRIFRSLQQEGKGDLRKLFMYLCRNAPAKKDAPPETPAAPEPKQ
jgi:hypothetical protein